MLRTLLSVASVLMLAVAPLHAAQARTYQDALKRVSKDKPFVMFCYGANYDEDDVRMYESFFKSKDKSLIKVISRETYLIVPVYQMPNEQEKKAFEKVMGKARIPGGIWSYPCLALVDAKGRVRGVVQSREELETPEKAAAALTALLDAYAQQQKILANYDKASPEEQRKMMRAALAIESIKVPGHAEADPSQNGVVEKLQTFKTISAAHAYIRTVLTDEKAVYSPVERQMILAAYAGYVRRNGGPPELLRAILTEMRNISPKSVYGTYAIGGIEMWVKPHEHEGLPQK